LAEANITSHIVRSKVNEIVTYTRKHSDNLNFHVRTLFYFTMLKW